MASWFSIKLSAVFINGTAWKHLKSHVQTSSQYYWYVVVNMQKLSWKKVPRSGESFRTQPLLPPPRLEVGDSGLLGRGSSFDHRLPVQVRCPVNEVESAKQDRKHNAGHLVDLADAVISLFALGCLLFRRFGGDSRRVCGPCWGLLLWGVWSMGHLPSSISIIFI